MSHLRASLLTLALVACQPEVAQTDGGRPADAPLAESDAVEPGDANLGDDDAGTGDDADTGRGDAAAPDTGTDDASPDAATPCVAGPSEPDTDEDGVVDRCDVCPNIPNPRQLDVDGDGRGWACDPVEFLPHPDISAFATFTNGILVHGSGRDLFTVWPDEVVLAGRTDGTDPTLLLANSNFLMRRQARGIVLIDGWIGSFLALQDAVPSLPVLALSGNDRGSPSYATTTEGLVFTYYLSGGGVGVGLLAPGEGPRALGTYPGAFVCPTDVPLFFVGDVSTPGETQLMTVVDGAAVRVSEAGTPLPPAIHECYLYSAVCREESGSLRVVSADRANATLELDTHHAGVHCADIRLVAARYLDATAIRTTADDGSVMVFRDGDGVEQAVVSAPPGTSLFAYFGSTEAYVSWSTPAGATFGRLDASTGVVVPLTTRPIVEPTIVVWADRLVAYGAESVTSPSSDADARLIVIDRAAVTRDQLLPGPGVRSGLAVGSRSVVTRHGAAAELWVDGEAGARSLSTSASSVTGVAHDDALAITVREAGVDRVLVAERSTGADVVREMPELVGLYTLHVYVLRNWYASDTELVHVTVGADGRLAVDERLPGRHAVAGGDGPDAEIFEVGEGASRRLMRLDPAGSETLATGAGVRLLASDGDRAFAQLGEFLCRVRGPEGVACWNVGTEQVYLGTIGPEGQFFGTTASSAAAVRNVGAPDRLTLP